jgi:radical SAM superfamily enzyme YgiQ (UPF0313 family)
MNILLVSPETPSTFWSFHYAMHFVSKKAAFPPLGLLTVAAMLPRDWRLRLVDQNVTRLTDADLDWADAVFLSAMIVHEPSARRVIARCVQKRKTLVAGGPLFTTGHERFPEVGCLAIGEAEPFMPELVADLAAGRLKNRYCDPRRADLSHTPPPRWDLIRLRHYNTMPVQFSRGCPFDCEFCDIVAMSGRVPRCKSPAQMIREIESLLAAGWRDSIFIVDDNFIGHKVKVKAFLRELVEWRRDAAARVSFLTEASLNLVDDPELLDLMVRAGFKKVFVGIETPEESSLLECAKVQNTRRNLVAAVRAIQKAGIEVMGGFIVGFDGDPPNIFERQFRFIQEAGIATAMVGLLTALPGTRLFARLSREGRILAHSTGNNVDAALNFVPRLDRDLLLGGYRALVRRLYAPKTHYRRILNFLREYRPCGPSPRLSWTDVKAFVKSLWVLGVWTPGRRAYWKFLLQAMLTRPRALSEAVTLAIFGYHFRRVASRI